MGLCSRYIYLKSLSDFALILSMNRVTQKLGNAAMIGDKNDKE